MMAKRAQRHENTLPDDFRNELARLVWAGFPLLPLGGGVDGKGPLLRVWSGPALPLKKVLAPLYRVGSQVYGIRLDGLAVIDCDADDPALVAAMEARFGPSPVHVKTPRGRHLYYRASAKAPNLRAEGLPVDIKSGPRAYVVGAHSLRPDGGLYVPAKGMLGVDALPALRATEGPQAGLAVTGTIAVETRHNTLRQEGLRMVEHVDSEQELHANLLAVRDDYCENPETVPDSEVQKIAAWVWTLRLENRLYRGRDSTFRINRTAFDCLRQSQNGADALLLYALLLDQHGHEPGKRFALNFKGMRAAGLVPLSISRLRAARRTLEANGLLELVGKHKAGSVYQTFALMRPRPANTDFSGIARMGTRIGARG